MKLSLSILSLGLVLCTGMVACSAGGDGASGTLDDDSAAGGAGSKEAASDDKQSEPDSAGGAGGASTEELIDDTPGVSITSTPADGSLGFYHKNMLTIEFSEPMDTDSVEAAFSSETLGDVSFWWSADSKVFKINPAEDLEFNAGWNPPAIEKNFYDFKIDKSALTAEGQPLDEDYEVEFAVANRIITSLDPLGHLSGSVRSDGTTWLNIYAGDSGQGEDEEGNDWWYIGLASFDLSELPGTMVMFESASLIAAQDISSGSPFLSLDGQVDIYDADFEARNWNIVVNGMADSPYGVLSDVGGDLEEVSAKVTSLVKDDLKHEQLSQFALRFPLDQNDDSGADSVEYQDAYLYLSYYAE